MSVADKVESILSTEDKKVIKLVVDLLTYYRPDSVIDTSFAFGELSNGMTREKLENEIKQGTIAFFEKFKITEEKLKMIKNAVKKTGPDINNNTLAFGIYHNGKSIMDEYHNLTVKIANEGMFLSDKSDKRTLYQQIMDELPTMTCSEIYSRSDIARFFWMPSSIRYFEEYLAKLKD